MRASRSLEGRFHEASWRRNGMRRPRPCFAGTAPGGVGAPPGGTMASCREPADDPSLRRTKARPDVEQDAAMERRTARCPRRTPRARRADVTLVRRPALHPLRTPRGRRSKEAYPAPANNTGAGACPETIATRTSAGLFENLVPACQEPAACANSQALAASGCTICARAGAFALAAVPSRTRPMMPCRIAASRKKL